MKIAIIGKGTSSIIQACVCLKYKHEVEIFYDPDVPPLSVGESTTPHLPSLLKSVLGVDLETMVNDCVISVKRGAAFLNWGKGIPFIHGFGGHPPDGNSEITSLHFDTVILNKFLNDKLEEIGVVYHAEKVTDIKECDDHTLVNGKKYDFVINCTGWNYDSNNIIEPLFQTVNAGYLYRDQDFSVSNDLTIFKATEDGWEFGLPFPVENTVRHGYLFNTNYISPEEVTEKMKAQGKEGRIFKWQPKKSKYLLENNRLAANGNRLFFNEPLQGYGILIYIEMAHLICEYLNSNSMNSLHRNAINLKYRRLMVNYEMELAWHYQYGSTFDSPFWNDVTQKARNVLYYHPSGSIVDLNEIIKVGEVGTKSIQRIFMHSREDLVYVHKWMLDMWTDEDKPNIKF